jgi:hypothetical protein
MLNPVCVVMNGDPVMLIFRLTVWSFLPFTQIGAYNRDLFESEFLTIIVPFYR